LIYNFNSTSSNCILIVPQMYLVHLKNGKLISGNGISNTDFYDL